MAAYFGTRFTVEVSRLFGEVLPRMCEQEPALRIVLFTLGRAQPLPVDPQIRQQRLFPVDDIVWPGNLWWTLALYTKRALEALARRFGKRSCTDGLEIHLLTDRAVPSILFRSITNSRLAPAISKLRRRRSLQSQDYYRITGKSLDG